MGFSAIPPIAQEIANCDVAPEISTVLPCIPQTEGLRMSDGYDSPSSPLPPSLTLTFTLTLTLTFTLTLTLTLTLVTEEEKGGGNR